MERPNNSREENIWDHRVARDLGKAFHEVGMEEYEVRAKKGFNIQDGEFNNPSEEAMERLFKLQKGSSLEKGLKTPVIWFIWKKPCHWPGASIRGTG